MRFVLIDKSHFLSDNLDINLRDRERWELMCNEILRVTKEVEEENFSKVLIEYSLIENHDDKFGIKVSKKNASNELCEQYTLEYVADEEDEGNEIIEILAKNIVTPITVENVLHDLGYII